MLFHTVLVGCTESLTISHTELVASPLHWPYTKLYGKKVHDSDVESGDSSEEEEEEEEKEGEEEEGEEEGEEE